MIILYLYFVLWILNPIVNIIFLLLAIAATVMSVSVVEALGRKTNTFVKFVIPTLVFFGVTHIGFLIGLATTNVEEGDIEVNTDMIKRRMKM